MAICRFSDSTIIGDYLKPYIVAELNSSHGGSLETAFEMILKAKEIGVDCVKFQSWSSETLYCKSYYDKNSIAKRIVSKFALSDKDLLEVSRFCKRQNIAFSSTPYSNKEVDFLLEKCNVPFIKIASMELNNHSYLKYIAGTKAPIVLSTGMGSIDEIRKAVGAIKNNGNHDLCILHCVSVYPADVSMTQLNNILGLREIFPDCPIGFSDHSIGIAQPTASVALGAAIVEKHFTLDNKKIGMDNQMATEVDEFSQMVQSCHQVFQAMGSKERIVFPNEIENRKLMRRSIVAARDLPVGKTITEDDLTLKRPGYGFQPEKIDELVGRILKRNVMFDTMIVESDFISQK